jgi:hypothetical protein
VYHIFFNPVNYPLKRFGNAWCGFGSKGKQILPADIKNNHRSRQPAPHGFSESEHFCQIDAMTLRKPQFHCLAARFVNRCLDEITGAPAGAAAIDQNCPVKAIHAIEQLHSAGTEPPEYDALPVVQPFLSKRNSMVPGPAVTQERTSDSGNKYGW